MAISNNNNNNASSTHSIRRRRCTPTLCESSVRSLTLSLCHIAARACYPLELPSPFCPSNPFLLSLSSAAALCMQSA